MTSPGADAAQAGPLIASLITRELDAQRAITASLQSRGLAVISSSGTLVTLLFGLSAVATTAGHLKLPGPAKPPLYVAAVLLVAAAVRAGNQVRARWLLAAIILEITGVASTMAAVIVLIAKG